MSTHLYATATDPLTPGYDLVKLETTSVGEPRALRFSSEGDMVGAPFALSHAQLESLAIQLLQAWQREIGVASGPTPLQTAVTQTPEEAARLRAVLASEGNYVFHELRDALDEPMRSVFDQLVKGHLAKADDDQRALVFMSDSLIPWRMLYADSDDLSRRIDEDDDPNSIDERGFLGLAGIVDHVIPITNPPSARRGTSVPFGVYTGFNTLPGGRTDVEAALSSRTDLKPTFVTTEVDFVTTILADDAALIYAYCHGRFRDSTVGMPIQELIFDTKPLTGQYVERRIKTKVGRLSTAPIAFVNACQGGIGGVDYATTVVNVLNDRGAGATAGPMLDMPTCFGGVFGSHVIGLLAQKHSLSSALIRATREYMTTHGNPLGLAYVSVNGRRASLR